LIVEGRLIWALISGSSKEIWQRRDYDAGDCEAVSEIIPEADFELSAVYSDAEHGVAGVAPIIAFCAAADFASGDDAADIVFGAVGMEGNVRAFEDLEEARSIGVDAREQAVEGDEAGLGAEDPVEPAG
jgi:hypothetical protein